MFLDYYKLIEQPFGVTPDSRFLYLGPKHREAFASLLYGTESNRGFLALIAKPGMGKTTLLYHYLSYLRGKARSAFVFRTDCDSRDFIRHVLLDLGIDTSTMDLPTMHQALNRVFTDEMAAGRRFVLVVDEAQNLEEKVLESIRLLSNFETPCAKLIQIVLAGQPQLADRLASPSMAQLRQRISMVIPIEHFTPEEVNAYIDHRLWIAGNEKRTIFTIGARKLIAEHSNGIPRNISNLCFHAMSIGCATKRSTIDRGIILDVIADLDLDRLGSKPTALKPQAPTRAESLPVKLSDLAGNPPGSARWAPRVAVAAAVLLLLGWPLLRVNQGEPRNVARLAGSPASAVALVSEVSVAHSDSAPTTVYALEKKTPKVLRVKPGETLYQIGMKNLGRCDRDVVSKFRELNPWLTDPDHIESGREILIPSAGVIPNNVQRAAGQATNIPPVETEKP